MKLELFLKLHEQFMSEENPFDNKALCEDLFGLLNQIDDPREIKNPLHPQGTTYGYVAIKHAIICTRDGAVIKQILVGDVLILQFNWDRNILVTHTPLNQSLPIPFMLRDNEHIHGYRGIWLPVFDPARIRGFAERQIERYQDSLNQLFDEEEAWWKNQMKVPG